MQVIGVPDDLNRELQYGQQQADRVDGDVPLAAVDLLGRVGPAAFLADGRGGLDRVGVDDRGGRRGLAAGCGAALAAQLVVPSRAAGSGWVRVCVLFDEGRGGEVQEFPAVGVGHPQPAGVGAGVDGRCPHGDWLAEDAVGCGFDADDRAGWFCCCPG
jgi:hypothetical protein